MGCTLAIVMAFNVAGVEENSRGFEIAHPRRKQQGGSAAALHRVIQLLSSGTLRLLADDRLRVDERSRAEIGVSIEQKEG